jgi:thiamine biosynthesis protein ThiS
VKITVNDEIHQFDTMELKLTEVLDKLNIPSNGIVVDIDGNIYNSNNFNEVTVKDGAKLELLRIVGGG